ncbi:MAG: DnaK suppressor protein [Nitrospirales bacterium]|nr:MAG: DnaK suppressor protein [Nitrospirales bacterium]
MRKESKTIHPNTTKGRKATLRKILLAKRDAITQAIKQQLGQSLTEEQQRRLESAMDSGDQALVDLDREMGISLQEMRNKERRQIEEALVSLEEGTYGMCAECGEEVSEKRLQALPFARLCVACQTNRELMEKIERAEQRS